MTWALILSITGGVLGTLVQTLRLRAAKARESTAVLRAEVAEDKAEFAEGLQRRVQDDLDEARRAGGETERVLLLRLSKARDEIERCTIPGSARARLDEILGRPEVK